MKTETIVGVDDKDTGLRGALEKLSGQFTTFNERFDSRMRTLENKMIAVSCAGYLVLFLLQRFWK